MKIKSVWPEMEVKSMTRAKRRKLNLQNIMREREQKRNKGVVADMIAKERKENKEADGKAAAEVRKRLMAANPGKSVRIFWNKSGTMQAKVAGKFVKIK